MKGTRTITARAAVALAAAAIAGAALAGGAAESASADSNYGAGRLCVRGWNNAEYEKDFFWAATGHFHGVWYTAYGEHCHRVKVSIRAYGGACEFNWPGPGNIIATNLQYDGYVTVSTYISPRNRYLPASDHIAWTPSWLVDDRYLCFR